ncbi:hypothetical protein K457DRAFT_843187 [Linnemannia elongata AG-77]|uniref:Uncharacterized protein n=1 Tax=Linnemannia elongata AG-77 TaxID=1314771 RepID=A0A197JH77_9FUNG|nr:hypothetical protein K457DRAFT_843187 [Linnemannia elongata AG-77]
MAWSFQHCGGNTSLSRLFVTLFFSSSHLPRTHFLLLLLSSSRVLLLFCHCHDALCSAPQTRIGGYLTTTNAFIIELGS